MSLTVVLYWIAKSKSLFTSEKVIVAKPINATFTQPKVTRIDVSASIKIFLILLLFLKKDTSES